MGARVVTDENGIETIIAIASFLDAKPSDNSKCLVCGITPIGYITIETKTTPLEPQKTTYYHTKCLN